MEKMTDIGLRCPIEPALTHFAARSRQTCPVAPHQRPCMQLRCAFPKMLVIHEQGAEHDQ